MYPRSRLLTSRVHEIQHLDLTKTAESHLYKSLLKFKSIASSESLPSNVVATLDITRKPQDAATTNVQARLFNSVPVKTSLVKILDDVRAVLGTEEQLENKRMDLDAESHAKEMVGAKDDQKSRLKESNPEHNWNGIPNSEDLNLESDLRSSDKKGANFELFESRVAESTEEPSSAADVQRHTESDWSGLEDLEGVEVEVGDTCKHGSSSRRGLPAKYEKPQKSATAAPRSTIFLPSLSMGGYWSGSEDGPDPDITAGKIDVKRNKRGQRARRAIYEKKYGHNANHLRKQAQSRDHGWDLHKGARGDGTGSKSRGRKRGFERTKTDSARRTGASRREVKATSSGANTEPIKPRAKAMSAAGGPLHPSWEAAKKAKESKQSTAFQGKKVIFE